MKNKKLVIKVCGEAGNGKTIIAQIIEYVLSEYGVENDCDDNDKYPLKQLFENLNKIKDNLEVEIETIQLKHKIDI